MSKRQKKPKRLLKLQKQRKQSHQRSSAIVKYISFLEERSVRTRKTGLPPPPSGYFYRNSPQP